MRYKQLSSLAVIELGKGTLLKEHRSSSLLGFDPGISQLHVQSSICNNTDTQFLYLVEISFCFVSSKYPLE